MQNLKVDKMRYQSNRSAYSFILLALVLNVVALFMSITPNTIVSDYLTAIDILANIIIMLLTFLSAEKCKVYDAKWSIGAFIIGFIMALQFFLYPTRVHQLGQLTNIDYVVIMVLLFGAAALMFVGGFITLKKHKMLQKHLKEIGE